MMRLDAELRLTESSLWLPLVGGVIIFDAALHVLKFVQHRKHVDELPQREQIGFRHKVLPPLGVTKTPHFPTEAIYCCPLREK